jgi:hypothetical protein
MPQQATVYRILMVSPADVEYEPKVTREVIDSWNAANSLKYRAILELVFWHTNATSEICGRPQSILNRQLADSCDILIGTFKTRLGTPTGVAEPGTVEEREIFVKAGKPVLLYFSLVPSRRVDSTQYQRLMEFKEECSKEGIVFEYESINAFRELLQRHITSTINSIHQ